MNARTILSLVLSAVLAQSFTLAGCKKRSENVTTEAEPTAEAEGGVVEGHDNGSIVWRVMPDGKTRAIVRSVDGKPIEKNVRGELLWRGATETRVPMTFEGNGGVLVATGPRLAGDLTEIQYTVTVDGKPWVGALHVPAGGTDELEATAKRAAAKPVARGARGPNGGVVQVVGDDVVEVVADKSSGQVRVYILDARQKPVAIGDRKVKLGVVGGSTEVVALAPDPGGLYFTGKLSAKIDPIKLTIAVTHAGHCEVAIFGYEPGAVVVVGAAARPIHVLVAVNWSVDVRVQPPRPGVVIVREREHWHGHGHGRWGHGKW